MILLIWLNFVRSGIVIAGIPLIVLASILGIFVGKEFHNRQAKSITEAAKLQQVQLDRYEQSFKDDIGYMLYYAKFSFVNKPSPLGGLSIGQRDINPTILSLTIRNIESQKYDSDLNNPYNQLIGHIDFSFVLIFLFPLLIIGFNYNILSEEKVSGTWNLASIQAERPIVLLYKLFWVRILLVSVTYLIIAITAGIILKTGFGEVYGKYVISGLMYIFLWFSICFMVISFQKSSNFNAQILLSVYLLLLIVIPAFLNSYLQNKYPVPEALELTIKQRKAYHEKWDMDKMSTMTKFYAHYPQFEQYTIPETDFSWPLYYAMQQLGDDESSEQSKDFTKKLKQRINASKRISYLLPTLHLQLQFNKLVKSDLECHLHFLEAVTTYHENIRLYFYPKIFENKPSTSENWDKWKIKYYEEDPSVSWSQLLLPLLVFTTLWTELGAWKLRKEYSMGKWL